jgi:hypothetical protein
MPCPYIFLHYELIKWLVKKIHFSIQRCNEHYNLTWWWSAISESRKVMRTWGSRWKDELWSNNTTKSILNELDLDVPRLVTPRGRFGELQMEMEMREQQGRALGMSRPGGRPITTFLVRVSSQASRMAAAVAGASRRNQPRRPSSSRAALTASRIASMAEQARNKGGSPTACMGMGSTHCHCWQARIQGRGDGLLPRRSVKRRLKGRQNAHFCALRRHCTPRGLSGSAPDCWATFRNFNKQLALRDEKKIKKNKN